MKNGKAVFLSAAVILGAAGMIFGNHMLASGALAADDTPEPAVVMPEGTPVNAIRLSDVGMYLNAEGGIYMAPTNVSGKAQEQDEALFPGEASALPDTEGGKSSTVVTGSAEDPFKVGTPTENELSSDKAQELAIAAIIEKYELTQKTLGKFTVTSKYFEVHPNFSGKHIWRVNLDPTNFDEFSEIGCYMSYIDAETGEIFQLNSAADGQG